MKLTFILTSIQTFFKILSGLIMNKIIAVYAGPVGLALLGQFQNFSTIVYALSNGSIQSGIVKYVAEYSEDNSRLYHVLRQALVISLAGSLFTGLFIYFFSTYLSLFLLGTQVYSHVFQIFSFVIILYAINLLVLSFLNGVGNILLYSILNIIINLLGVLLILVLTISVGLYGALIGIALSQSIFVFISIIGVSKLIDFKCLLKHISLDVLMIKRLLHYGLASFANGAMTSLTALIIRYFIVSVLSSYFAGIWEAGWRIVFYFNLVFFMPISIYYLPKFVSARSPNEMSFLLKECFKFSIPLMLFSIICFYFIKADTINLLFSNEFGDVAEIIMPMLFGGCLNVVSSVINTIFFAKSNVLISIILSFLYSVCTVVCVLGFIYFFGFFSAGYAFFISSLIYLILSLMFYKMHKFRLYRIK